MEVLQCSVDQILVIWPNPGIGSNVTTFIDGNANANLSEHQRLIKQKHLEQIMAHFRLQVFPLLEISDN